MSENWRQSEICSTAKHLSCDGLLCYKFIIQFAGEIIFKIGEHVTKLPAKWSIVSYALVTLDFCPEKMHNSPDK